ncbi:MAG: hypothetical protein IJV68_05695 [Clostridia bacterium]|nr:hypothetical protein [Clostridia bacterium]
MKNYDDEIYTEESEEQAPKKKKFNIFDWYYNRETKGVDDDGFIAADKPSFKNFFKLLWRKLSKLMSCNIFFIFANFPLIFLLIAMSGILTQQSVAPYYQSIMSLNGAMLFDSNPTIMSLLSVYGVHTTISAINTPTLIFFVLGLLTVFTWGFAKVGTTYVYRNLMKGEAVFPFSDAWYIIKKNVKKCLIFGILDFVFIALNIYNVAFLINNYTISAMNSFMFFFTLVICIVYFFMRPYMFTMIFTFNLSSGKIIKNAFYFVILGVKRNFVAFFGSIALVLLNYGLCMIFLPIGIILPFIITIAIFDMIGVYASYPIIKKYMIDPQMKNKPKDTIEELADGIEEAEINS